MRQTRWSLWVCVVGVLLSVGSARAEVSVSKAFGNHMVLQQNQPIRVWGAADKGEKVTVTLGDATASTSADAKGAWRVELPARKADGKSLALTVAGSNKIEFTDVLLGEVWICSGQSNMQWPMRKVSNAEKEVRAADYPKLRLFHFGGTAASATPKDQPRGEWKVCTPQTVRDFSAVAYFFGRALVKDLNVPVGLIGTYWGGTRIEPWTPRVGLEAVPQLKDCLATVDTAQKSGDERKLMLVPTYIYNGMVHPFVPMSVRGVVWYQGEANEKDGVKYEFMTEALVKGWRSMFQNEDLSFYWVQLPYWNGPSRRPEGSGWGPIREGQRRALRLPKTGMAVTIDIGSSMTIHPPAKQDVGRRLALLALAKDYGRKITCNGPLYKSMAIEGNKIRISFDSVGGGLIRADRKNSSSPIVPSDGKDLNEFSIQDGKGQWHWAKAKIDGKTVVVWADDVPDPKHVRLGYQSNPSGFNLYNKELLPASPFSTTPD